MKNSKITFANNSSDDKKYMFDKFFDNEITKIVNDDHDFYEKIQQPEINKSLKELLFKSISKKLNNDQKINSKEYGSKIHY